MCAFSCRGIHLFWWRLFSTSFFLVVDVRLVSRKISSSLLSVWYCHASHVFSWMYVQKLHLNELNAISTCLPYIVDNTNDGSFLGSNELLIYDLNCVLSGIGAIIAKVMFKWEIALFFHTAFKVFIWNRVGNYDYCPLNLNWTFFLPHAPSIAHYLNSIWGGIISLFDSFHYQHFATAIITETVECFALTWAGSFDSVSNFQINVDFNERVRKISAAFIKCNFQWIFSFVHLMWVNVRHVRLYAKWTFYIGSVESTCKCIFSLWFKVRAVCIL